METYLIVCDEIIHDKERNAHRLGTVLNRITVPTLPFVYDVSVLVKTLYIPATNPLDSMVVIKDADDQVVAVSDMIVLRNYRTNHEVPGVDCNIDLQLIICRDGKLDVELYIDKEKTATYPLYVSVQTH